MKKIALLILLISVSTSGQISKSAKMGQTTLEELQLTSYEKDVQAPAVVLYDQGNLYTFENNLSALRTDYYFRIKILKKEGLHKATIRLPIYNYSQKNQEIRNIKAITYNLENGVINKTTLLEKDIHTIKINNSWKEIKFALPNVRVGSVIEYSYTKVNPFFLEIDDWYFQDDIPKINSEFHSSIVGNYQYKAKLNGYFKLSKNNPSVKKRCVSYTGNGYTNLTGDCNILDLGMKDVPAFKKEKHLTSRENYISKISFQLETIFYSNGKKDHFTSTWKGADKKLKSGIFFGAELKKSSFFKKNLPEEIMNMPVTISKAKKMYYFLQNHFNNNHDGGSFQKINTKKAFDEKTGSSADINMSLYNALKAGGFTTHIVLGSTRDHGTPTKLYPIINDFNFLIVALHIDNHTYFLDAASKALTFGMPSIHMLNGDARIMDFRKGSYWQNVSPSVPSNSNTLASIKITEDGKIERNERIVKKGYLAQATRNILLSTTQKSYLDQLATDNNINITEYTDKGLSNQDTQLTQQFRYSNEKDASNSSKLYVNLFAKDGITKNPFTLESRFYPVNFGFAFSKSFRANIAFPVNYSIKNLPKSSAFSLPNNGGTFIFNCKLIGNKINVFFKYHLRKVEYTNEEYHALKEFFNQIIKAYSTTFVFEPK